MAEEDASAARVVVALNVLWRDPGVLELAVGLAARRQARLLALLVEDMNLLNLAELPFAKEVGRLSAAERKLDSLRLMRTVRARAGRIRGILDRLNENLQIDVECKTVRGHFIPAVLSELGRVDILLLARSPDAERRRALTMPPPVWTVYDGSAGSERALRLAAELATAEACGLCIVLPAASEAEFEARRARILSLGAGLPSPRFVPASPSDGAELRRKIRQTGCRLLVVKREDGEITKEALAGTVECPVILV